MGLLAEQNNKIRENILKSFEVDQIDYAEEGWSSFQDILLKARGGRYMNTSENRKKGIVGQKYGGSGISDKFDKFVTIAKNSTSVKDFMSKVQKITDVPASVATDWFNTYGEGGKLTIEQASQNFINSVNGGEKKSEGSIKVDVAKFINSLGDNGNDYALAVSKSKGKVKDYLVNVIKDKYKFTDFLYSSEADKYIFGKGDSDELEKGGVGSGRRFTGSRHSGGAYDQKKKLLQKKKELIAKMAKESDRDKRFKMASELKGINMKLDKAEEDEIQKSDLQIHAEEIMNVDQIEKARSGRYQDTPENRKKGIVGQKYGKEKLALPTGKHDQSNREAYNQRVKDAKTMSSDEWYKKHKVGDYIQHKEGNLSGAKPKIGDPASGVPKKGEQFKHNAFGKVTVISVKENIGDKKKTIPFLVKFKPEFDNEQEQGISGFKIATSDSQKKK